MSSCSHVAAGGTISFSFMANIPRYTGKHIFIRRPVGGHLGCFQALAIVSRPVVNTGVHGSFRNTVFSGYPGVVTLVSVFRGTSRLLSVVVVSIYMPTDSAGPSLFSTLSSLHCRRPFDDARSDGARWYLAVALTCVSLATRDVEHLVMRVWHLRRLL